MAGRHHENSTVRSVRGDAIAPWQLQPPVPWAWAGSIYRKTSRYQAAVLKVFPRCCPCWLDGQGCKDLDGFCGFVHPDCLRWRNVCISGSSCAKDCRRWKQSKSTGCHRLHTDLPEGWKRSTVLDPLVFGGLYSADFGGDPVATNLTPHQPALAPTTGEIRGAKTLFRDECRAWRESKKRKDLADATARSVPRSPVLSRGNRSLRRCCSDTGRQGSCAQLEP